MSITIGLAMSMSYEYIFNKNDYRFTQVDMAHDNILDGHILNIVQNHRVLEQVHLQEMLEERGYKISQATLSRKLKNLKIAKVEGVYKVVDFSMPSLPIVLNIKVSEFGTIILHTYPGHANGLAYFLDQKYVAFSPQQSKNSGILGTIAGDDTVLVIIESKSSLEGVLNIIKEEFPYLKV